MIPWAILSSQPLPLLYSSLGNFCHLEISTDAVQIKGRRGSEGVSLPFPFWQHFLEKNDICGEGGVLAAKELLCTPYPIATLAA